MPPLFPFTKPSESVQVATSAISEPTPQSPGISHTWDRIGPCGQATLSRDSTAATTATSSTNTTTTTCDCSACGAGSSGGPKPSVISWDVLGLGIFGDLHQIIQQHPKPPAIIPLPSINLPFPPNHQLHLGQISRLSSAGRTVQPFIISPTDNGHLVPYRHPVTFPFPPALSPPTLAPPALLHLVTTGLLELLRR